MSKLLQINHVSKYYGMGTVVTRALDDISFALDKGEFTAIMGTSGSGKSTLLNVISTIDRVSAGEILLEGKDLTRMKEHRLAAFRRDQLGFVFQEYNLLDTLTIRENIVLPLNLKRVSAKETQKKLEEVSRVLGLDDQLQKFPWELSGGQRQRAACARALIAGPSLILADEPTGALDSGNSRILMETFEMMNERLGATILLVTHDAAVGAYAGRVLFLKDGKIFGEVRRGSRSRQEMYREILALTSAQGGDSHVG